LSRARRHLLLSKKLAAPRGFEFSGIGIDVGGGIGLMASHLANEFPVEQIYCVEICRSIVDLLTLKISSHILGKNVQKVVPVHGTFDDMQLGNLCTSGSE
jgi:hypothetical protein